MKVFIALLAVFAFVATCYAGLAIPPNKATGEYGRICSSPLPPPHVTPPCVETAYRDDNGKCPDGFKYSELSQFCERTLK